MANQMISIPTSLNDNISSLVRKLKVRGLLKGNEEKDRARDRMDQDITFINLDQMGQKKQEHILEEIHKAYEATKMMQKLEKKTKE